MSFPSYEELIAEGMEIARENFFEINQRWPDKDNEEDQSMLEQIYFDLCDKDR